MENPETKVSKTDDEEINNTLELEVSHKHGEYVMILVKKIGYFKQIPLKIAYALTIHSCQGSTLDSAEVDLSDTFEHGQVYTALSRQEI